MSKMSDQFHKMYAQHHTEKAQIHFDHHEAHASMAKHHAEGPEHEFHKSKAALHEAAHESHVKLAAYHEKMQKASADELNKGTVELPASLEDAVKSVFLKMFGNTVMPSNVSGITPDRPGAPRMVPRAGMQPIPETPNVPFEFQKLVAIEDGSAE